MDHSVASQAARTFTSSRLEERIAEAAVTLYTSLGRSCTPQNPLHSSITHEFTVIAAFVAEDPTGQVFPLSLASGTKCLGAREVAEAVPGTILKDSHAEVLARR